MKRIALVFSLFFMYALAINAESAALKTANDLYIKRNYEGAIKQYEAIIKSDGVAPELYYNLGNAYYKTNEVAHSILNYERALRLDPSFDDARYNLEIAQLKVVDNIVQAPTFFLGRWIDNLIKVLSSNQWLVVSLLLFLIGLSAVFVFVFGNTRFRRKFAFYAGIVLFSVTFVTLIFSGVRKKQMTSRNQAIIMSGAVTVKSSPDKSGTDLFQLHEGTKVAVKSTLGEWVEIKLGNGNIGWVKDENIERI